MATDEEFFGLGSHSLAILMHCSHVVLVYNLRRALNILGVETMMAAVPGVKRLTNAAALAPLTSQ